MVKKRGKGEIWHIRFRKDNKELWVATSTTLKREAERIEQLVKHVVRTGDYSYLDHESRLVCIRLFRNQGWELPEALITTREGEPVLQPEVREELTLKEAARMCFSDPQVRAESPLYKERLRQCFMNLFGNKNLGPAIPVKAIQIKNVKQYMQDRLDEGAALDTVKREKGALSKIFQILMENNLHDRNPARETRWRTNKKKSVKRRVYLGLADFLMVVKHLPDFYKPLALLAFYTGMRQGEVRRLTRNHLDLPGRMIRLSPQDTKEGDEKRVPLHREIIPILKSVLGSQVVGIDRVFLRDGEPIERTQLRRSWEYARAAAGLPDLNFHDLRHTWKANARRSGMDEEIRKAIMGHEGYGSGTHEGYGWVSDEELVAAVDTMTFDNGKTVIRTAHQKNENPTAGTAGQFHETGAKRGQI